MAKKKASIAQPYDTPSTNPKDLAALYLKFGIDIKKPTSEASKRGLSLLGDNSTGGAVDMEMAAKRLKEGESYAPGQGLAVIRTERVGTTTRSGAGRDGTTVTPGYRDLNVYGRVGPAPAAAPPPPPPAPTPITSNPSAPLAFGDFGAGSTVPALQPSQIAAPTPPQQILMPGMSQVVRDAPADVRRRRSVARQSGQTRLGTGQLRIGARSSATPGSAPRSSRATGLNIGVPNLRDFSSGRPARKTGLGMGMQA